MKIIKTRNTGFLSGANEFVDQLLNKQIYNDRVFEMVHFECRFQLDDIAAYFNRIFWEDVSLRRRDQKYHVINDQLEVAFDISLSEILTYIQSVMPPVFKNRIGELDSINKIYDTFVMFLTDRSNVSTWQYCRDAFLKHIHLDRSMIDTQDPNMSSIKRIQLIEQRLTEMPRHNIIGIVETSTIPIAALCKIDKVESEYTQMTFRCKSQDEMRWLIPMLHMYNAHITRLFIDPNDPNTLYVAAYSDVVCPELASYIACIYKSFIN